MKTAPGSLLLRTEKLSAFFNKTRAVNSISLDVFRSEVVALIGPSGCGKSTFLRCLNRLHEEVPGATVDGRVLLEDEDIYGAGVDPVEFVAKSGWFFKSLTLFLLCPFSTMSPRD